MKTRAIESLPNPVMVALKKLGADIALARKRRRIPAAEMAERALTSRNTLDKVEKGDPAVSMAIYASILSVLGMIDGLANVAAPETDSIGLQSANETLPKRIRQSKPASTA